MSITLTQPEYLTAGPALLLTQGDSYTGDRWITASDMAQVLKMSPRQVHRYGEAGKIRTKRAGRRVLYHAGDVQALAGHYRQPAAAQHDSRLAITSDAQTYLD